MTRVYSQVFGKVKSVKFGGEGEIFVEKSGELTKVVFKQGQTALRNSMKQQAETAVIYKFSLD